MFIPYESIDDYLPRWSEEGFDADILKIVEDLNLKSKRTSPAVHAKWISH